MAKTLSGTDIINVVNVSFSNIKGQKFSILSATTNKVSDFIDFYLKSKIKNQNVFAGTISTYSFILSNRNNFFDKFKIQLIENNTNFQYSFYIDNNKNELIDGNEMPITNTPSFGEGDVINFIVKISVPFKVKIWQTNKMVFKISSFRTNTMKNSIQYLTNFLIIIPYTNSIKEIWVSDGIKKISNLDGNDFLGENNIFINIKFQQMPKDFSSVKLWYDISVPDGEEGENLKDKCVKFNFNKNWVAVIPADDPLIKDGNTIQFIIEADGVIYKPIGDSAWKFKIKARPNQGGEFNIFPTIVDASKEDFLITWKIKKRKNVNIEIYDLKGSLVWQNNFGFFDKGEYGPFKWDCKNHNGENVAAGLYFVIFNTKESLEIRKVIIK